MGTILQRIAAGDQTAVDECIREYGGLVWRLARRHLDRADSEVEDAVQDVFVEVWQSAGRFDPKAGSEAAFVATLAHRRLIDRQRRVTSRRRTIDRAAKLKAVPVLEGKPEKTVSPDDQAALASAFDELPESEREALWMAVFGGLSHREIGLATESPIGTVKSRLRRGMTRLTEVLAGGSAEVKGGAS